VIRMKKEKRLGKQQRTKISKKKCTKKEERLKHHKSNYEMETKKEKYAK